MLNINTKQTIVRLEYLNFSTCGMSTSKQMAKNVIQFYVWKLIIRADAHILKDNAEYFLRGLFKYECK